MHGHMNTKYTKPYSAYFILPNLNFKMWILHPLSHERLCVMGPWPFETLSSNFPQVVKMMPEDIQYELM